MKTIKTFKEISKIKKKDILKKNKKHDKKYIISIARQIADGFDDIDLRKEPLQKDYTRAKKYVKEFFNSVTKENTIFKRPKKENRKIYADYSGNSSKLKVFPMPVISNDDKFEVTYEIKGKKKVKKIKRVGKFTKTEFFEFENKKNLVKNPKDEVSKTYKRINKKLKNKKYAVKIKCGQSEYGAIYRSEKTEPSREIELWINKYGVERVKEFCSGLNVYEFHNQEDLKNLRPSKKKKKNVKKKN